jgi:hypothetical protein
MPSPKLSDTRRVAHLAHDICRKVEKAGFGIIEAKTFEKDLDRWSSRGHTPPQTLTKYVKPTLKQARYAARKRRAM